MTLGRNTYCVLFGVGNVTMEDLILRKKSESPLTQNLQNFTHRIQTDKNVQWTFTY